MIVKVKSGNWEWSYFEGDQVIQHKVNTLAKGSYDETISFIKPFAENTKDEHKLYLSLCICKEKRVVSRILTNRATYLMNDQGKTVDKLL